ncbi:hypothetical protein M9H77_16242 [Catharanthus roseus]|uniref:Uncharacterized protein n=1 Tax=Catharanthus roseus TaxID=4058 RepID=A0ACC0B0W3_CATRO|nr:hypothetical protein M9H77_16242 [Catharanthus roseus]
MSKISRSRNKRLDKTCDVPAPTQRKKVKASDWEQTGPTKGGSVNSELIPSYNRALLKCQSHYMALTGYLMLLLAPEVHCLLVTELQVTYSIYWVASSLFTDKSGNIVSLKLWPLAWIYMYFPMFAPTVRPGTQSCKPYIQQYPMLGYKIEHKLLDICLQLDTMLADEFRQCIPAHPIQPMEARKPANNRMYVVRNLFLEALWLEAPSHLLTETWTSVPAIPPSNPLNIPRRFHVPVDPPMPPQALLDLVARKARREDAEKEEKFDSIADLLMRHYHTI